MKAMKAMKAKKAIIKGGMERLEGLTLSSVRCLKRIEWRINEAAAHTPAMKAMKRRRTKAMKAAKAKTAAQAPAMKAMKK